MRRIYNCQNYAEEDIEAICDCLIRGDLKASCDINDAITKAVLEDAVTGSTYYGAAIAGVSPQQLTTIGRAGKRLADKIGKFIGRKIEYPLY